MTNIQFNPLQASEKTIENATLAPGFLYFATDSGKIFLDTVDKRINVGGGGTAIYYASSTSVVERPDGSYWINKNNLDNERVSLKSGDLIINSDGRFFKVLSFNEDTNIIICSLLAVSGTGGGTGGIPDGPSGNEKDIIVDWHDMVYSFIAGTPYYISFTATSKVDKYLNVEYKVQTEVSIVETKSLQIISGEKVSIEVGSKMATSGSNAVYFTITGANSNTFNQKFTKIKAIDFRIEQDNNSFTNYEIYKTVFNYFVNIYGEIDKTLFVKVDNDIVKTQFLGTEDYTSLPVEIQCSKLLPGVHTITAWLEAEGIPSEKVITDFIYHPEGAENATYVLVTEYPEKVYSYENPVVKYWVWDTSKQVGTINDIKLFINNDLVEVVNAAQNLGASAYLEWPVSGLKEKTNVLKLESGAGKRSFEIQVEKSDIFEPIKEAAVLLLGAEGRTNNTSLERRLDWSYKRDNQVISAKLSNFNWYNNGWVLDDNNKTCLRISNGAKVEIPMVIFKDSAPSVGGYTIEFEFKPYNLYNYQLLTTSVSTSGEDEKVEVDREFDSSKATIKYVQGKEAAAYGFCLGTQDAYFRLGDGTNVAARYKDEEILNVAMTVDAANQQMFIYINGVMSGMVGYERTSGALPIYAEKIEINSEYCDLDLYNIRIYEKVLTSKDIVQNYISSKKDLTLYNSNKLSAGETINLNELIEYNKNNPENATIPYMIITTKAPDILPYIKVEEDKDAIKVDVEFVNPSLDYNFNLGKYEEEEYLQKAPSF